MAIEFGSTQVRNPARKSQYLCMAMVLLLPTVSGRLHACTFDTVVIVRVSLLRVHLTLFWIPERLLVVSGSCMLRCFRVLVVWSSPSRSSDPFIDHPRNHIEWEYLLGWGLTPLDRFD